MQPELFSPNAIHSAANTSEESINTLVSIMALESIKGVGQKTIEAIYDLGIINKIWSLNKIDLENALTVHGKKKINLPQIIAEEKIKLLESGKEKAERIISRGISFITNKDQSFPSRLHIINSPPKWLFVLGNLSALSSTGIVAIIGTRDASSQGKLVAYHLAKEFVINNIVVLSGLAPGIDKQAHIGATKYYGQSIGILGHGFDAAYTNNDKHLWDDIVNCEGAVITEYLPAESPSRENFLRRNELQAALSHLVIPIEAPDLASGTGATIRRAINLKIPLLGIIVDQYENPSLIKTAENLQSLKIPTFRLPAQRELFLDHVRSNMPSHQWTANPRERQKRFLQILFGGLFIINDFASELRRASFSEEDIDWLSEEIKKRLG